MFLKSLRLTAPTVEPVTLAEAKAQLRVDDTDSDSYITACISAARDKTERYLNRYIAECSVALFFSKFPTANNPFYYNFPDVSAITEISYINAGVDYTLAAGYVLDAERERITSVADWPTADGGVRVEVTIGLDFSASPEPLFSPAIKQAILLYISDMFEVRADLALVQTYDNKAAEMLLYPHRVRIGV